MFQLHRHNDNILIEMIRSFNETLPVDAFISYLLIPAVYQAQKKSIRYSANEQDVMNVLFLFEWGIVGQTFNC